MVTVLVKQLIELIPLIFFFGSYKLYDIHIATLVLMVASSVQVLLSYCLLKKVEKAQFITFFLVILLGGMTIFLHDESFIKWKVTVTYTVFALCLSVSHFSGKSIIKSALGKDIKLPECTWSKISWAWIGFFLACAIVNTLSTLYLPLESWVNFKVFGLFSATAIYTLLTWVYIQVNLPRK